MPCCDISCCVRSCCVLSYWVLSMYPIMLICWCSARTISLQCSLPIIKIFFTNEDNFPLGGYVNKQYYCICDSDDPDIIVEKPLPSYWKCIEEDNTVRTFNSEHYGRMMNFFCLLLHIMNWTICSFIKIVTLVHKSCIT